MSVLHYKQGVWTTCRQLTIDGFIYIYWSHQCVRLCSLFLNLLPTPIIFHSLKLSEARVITIYYLWPIPLVAEGIIGSGHCF